MVKYLLSVVLLLTVVSVGNAETRWRQVRSCNANGQCQTRWVAYTVATVVPMQAVVHVPMNAEAACNCPAGCPCMSGGVCTHPDTCPAHGAKVHSHYADCGYAAHEEVARGPLRQGACRVAQGVVRVASKLRPRNWRIFGGGCE